MRLPTPLRLIIDNAPTGEMLKDEGTALARANAPAWWRQGWHDIVDALPMGWEGTGEDIRFMCLRSGLPAPTSSKRWGSMISGAIKQGILEFKVPWVWVVPNDPVSHARASRILRRTEFF